MNKSLNQSSSKYNFRIITLAIIAATLLPSMYRFILGEPTSQLTKLIQAIPCEIILVIVTFLLGTKLELNRIGLKKPVWRKLYWLIPEILLLAAILFSISTPALSPSPQVILMLLFLALLVGFYEELLSRGVILHILARHGKLELAILGSGIVFGILHFSSYNGTNGVETFQQIVETFAAGIYGAVIALALRSIIPLMITHFIYDFFLFIRLYFESLSTNTLTQETIQAASLLDFSYYIIPLAYLIVAFVIYHFEKNNIKQFHQELKEASSNNEQVSTGHIIKTICTLCVIIVCFNLIFHFLL